MSRKALPPHEIEMRESKKVSFPLDEGFDKTRLCGVDLNRYVCTVLDFRPPKMGWTYEALSSAMQVWNPRKGLISVNLAFENNNIIQHIYIILL